MEVQHSLPVLETKRLLLRAMRHTDAEDMFEYVSDKETTKYMSFETYTDIKAVHEFITYVTEKIRAGKCKDFVFELKESGKVIGAGGVFDFCNIHCVNVGYIINKKYWGRGLAAEAVSGIIKYLFGELDVHRVEAYHFAANTNSGRVMQKLGMACEGIFKDKVFVRGKYFDAVYYALINPKHKI